MNALLLSALLGVGMMFSSFLLKENLVIRMIALGGLILILASTMLELNGTVFFTINTRGMISFDRFALLFNIVIFATTLIYFLLSSKDMEKVGNNYAEY